MNAQQQRRWNDAVDLFERARAGDQVAMAILVQVRIRAKNGDPRARESLAFLGKVLKKNPPGAVQGRPSGTTRFGGESTPAIGWKRYLRQACALADGATIDNDVVFGAEGAMKEEDSKKSFRGGFMHWREHTPPDGACPYGWTLGNIFGFARAMQRVARYPNTPLAVLCPVVAWELE